MIVLGMDTSTAATSVAVLLQDGSALQARDDPAAGDHPGHATRLLRMAAELLGRAEVGWSALGRVAVGTGPGRFTGLRVGVATARGIAQSLAIELAGVPSLRALAEGALAAAESSRVLAVIDALRAEVFAAAYERDGAGAIRELELPAVLSARELAGWLAGAQARTGDPWLAVGDGAVRYRDELQAAAAEVPEDASPLHVVDARAICALGARAPAAALHQLVPDYRRRPDAERRVAPAASPARSGDRRGAPAAGGGEQLQGALR